MDPLNNEAAGRNTPAARAYVNDRRVGRTRPDLLELRNPKLLALPTPELVRSQEESGPFTRAEKSGSFSRRAQRRAIRRTTRRAQGGAA